MRGWAPTTVAAIVSRIRMFLSSRRTLTLPSATLPLLGPGLSGLLLSGLLSGCFLGDAADGLECELDADCGLGVVCAADPAAPGTKCCGGSCLVAGNSTGPSSTSAATESASFTTEGSGTAGDLCGNDVLDEGEICDATAPEGPACGPDCTLCGNGLIDSDQGEECDESAPNGSPCSATCTLCGNGELDPDEGCDNPDNMNCGEDCSYKMPCGNGSVDPGEACDVWGLPEGQTCNMECTRWLAFDWTAGDRGGFCESESDCTRWGQASDKAPWGSGEYFHNEDEWLGPPTWPEAVLRTRSIALPALETGDRVRVTLDHEFTLDFLDNDGQLRDSEFVDHVELSLESVGDEEPLVRNIQFGNETISCSGVLGTECAAGAEEYCPGRAGSNFVRAARELPEGRSPSTYSYLVPETGVPAGEYRIRFKVRYDCTNFVNGGPIPPTRPQPDAWTVRSVAVRVEKAGS